MLRELLAKAPGATAVLADLRDPDTVLRAAGSGWT